MSKNYKECLKTVICTYNTSLVYFISWVIPYPLIYLVCNKYFSFSAIIALSIGIGHLVINILLVKLCKNMNERDRPYTSAFWVNLDTLRVLLLIGFILYYGSRFS
jgi:hypothetical protein